MKIFLRGWSINGPLSLSGHESLELKKLYLCLASLALKLCLGEAGNAKNMNMAAG